MAPDQLDKAMKMRLQHMLTGDGCCQLLSIDVHWMFQNFLLQEDLVLRVWSGSGMQVVRCMDLPPAPIVVKCYVANFFVVFIDSRNSSNAEGTGWGRAASKQETQLAASYRPPA